MDENQFPKMDKTAISVVSLEEANTDEVEYWLSKTPYERLNALETLRQIFYGSDPTTTRLQRVLEITERVGNEIKVIKVIDLENKSAK
jgi:hypothetical protein